LVQGYLHVIDCYYYCKNSVAEYYCAFLVGQRALNNISNISYGCEQTLHIHVLCPWSYLKNWQAVIVFSVVFDYWLARALMANQGALYRKLKGWEALEWWDSS